MIIHSIQIIGRLCRAACLYGGGRARRIIKDMNPQRGERTSARGRGVKIEERRTGQRGRGFLFPSGHYPIRGVILKR